MAVELVAVDVTERTTTWLKQETNRTRPNEGSDTSMPSGHASTSASLMTLANRNLKYIDAVGYKASDGNWKHYSRRRSRLGTGGSGRTLSFGFARRNGVGQLAGILHT
jgi:hypothetical protein